MDGMNGIVVWYGVVMIWNNKIDYWLLSVLMNGIVVWYGVVMIWNCKIDYWLLSVLM